MTPEVIVNLGQQALQVMMLVSAPLLLTALVVGLLVSIFQAATSINEQTMTFVPKLVVMFIVMILAGPWMLQVMVDYVTRLFSSIPQLIQ